MGINVRVQNAPKPDGIIAAQVKLENDLRSCMQCRFFYGNNSQCLAKKCVKEESRPEAMEHDKEDMCYGCPYKQSDIVNELCLCVLHPNPIEYTATTKS